MIPEQTGKVSQRCVRACDGLDIELTAWRVRLPLQCTPDGKGAH